MKYFSPVYDDNGLVYSCDMLRLTFSLLQNRAEQFFNWLHNFYCYSDYWGMDHKNSFSYFAYRHFFSFRHGDEVVALGVGLNSYNNDDQLKCFVEFNPNKMCMEELRKLLLTVSKYVEKDIDNNRFIVKRWDLAVDIPIRRDLCKLLREGKKENHVILCDGSKTEYNGKRNHAGFCKLYDKQKESKLDHELTRLEITYEGYDTGYLPVVQLFDDQIYLSPDLNDTQKVLVELIRMQPLEDQEYFLNRLGRVMAAKIKKYIYRESDRLQIDLFSIAQVKENVRRLSLCDF